MIAFTFPATSQTREAAEPQDASNPASQLFVVPFD
jgi:hypothetical protein